VVSLVISFPSFFLIILLRKQEKMIIKDIMSSAVILVISIYLYVQATRMPARKEIVSVGDNFWPMIVLIGMMVSSACLLLSSLYQKKLKKELVVESEELKDYKSLFNIVIICILFVYFMFYTGFIILTPFYMATLMYLLGERRKKRLIVVSLGMTLFIMIVFVKILYIPLPRGKWFFRVINLLIY